MLKYFIVILLALIAGFILFLYLNMKSMKRKVLIYSPDGKYQVESSKDHRYKTAGDKNLLLDIYTPEGVDKGLKLPVIILVHGEGPEIFIKDAKDWGVYTSYGKLLASRGFAAVTFNHRYAGRNFQSVREAADDVRDAVKYIQANANQWNFDLDKIFIWSFSLGGIYSSIFLNRNYHIRGVISYYGLLDITQRIPANMVAAYDDFTPRKYLRNVEDIKILIVKAEKDKIRGIKDSIDNFINVADEYQINYNYMNHPTGGHSFDVFDDSEESKAIIKKTLEFIENSCR